MEKRSTGFMRRLVSKKKKRFEMGGYDLDLTYVTPRIIAMGFPSEGVESYYRNPASEVAEFLGKYHGDHVWIFNLCSERSYDPSLFGNRVSVYPFDDHNPPPLAMMAKFCEEAKTWTDKSKENVVAIHCKAGKGRTGVMISALLLWQNHWPNPTDAMVYFGQMRTHNSKGITIPSQHRFVAYFGELLVNYDIHRSDIKGQTSSPVFDTKAALAVAELVDEYDDEDDDDGMDEEEDGSEDVVTAMVDPKGAPVRALGEKEFGQNFRTSLAHGQSAANSVISSASTTMMSGERGKVPPPLPVSLVGLRLSSLPFIPGVKKWAPHIKVTTWGADGLSVHSEPITYDSSSFLAINPVRPFKGLQLDIPFPALPVVNEFKVELSHKPKRGKKQQLLCFWLHSAFIRVGDESTGTLTLPKSELDKLVKKDKKHKVLPADFKLDLSFEYDLPKDMLEGDKKFWQEKSDNADNMHQPQKVSAPAAPRGSSWLRMLPATTTVRRGMVMIPKASTPNKATSNGTTTSPSLSSGGGTTEGMVETKIKQRRKSLELVDSEEKELPVDKVIAWARAGWAFSPSDSSELQLEKGYLVAVTSWTNNDWWAGFAFQDYDDALVSFTHPARVFPAKYVKVFATAGHATLPDNCVAAYKFAGNLQERDLIFSSGDEITPLGTISEDWCFGKITKRNTPTDTYYPIVGNFPTGYVKPAPPPSSPAAPSKPNRPFIYNEPDMSLDEQDEYMAPSANEVMDISSTSSNMSTSSSEGSRPCNPSKSRPPVLDNLDDVEDQKKDKNLDKLQSSDSSPNVRASTSSLDLKNKSPAGGVRKSTTASQAPSMLSRAKSNSSITERSSTSSPRASSARSSTSPLRTSTSALRASTSSLPRSSTASSPRPSLSASRASTSSLNAGSRLSVSRASTSAPSLKPKPKAGFVPAAAKNAQSVAKQRAQEKLMKEKKEQAERIAAEKAAAKLEKQKRDEAALEARKAKVAAARSGRGAGRGGAKPGRTATDGRGRGGKPAKSTITTTKKPLNESSTPTSVTKKTVPSSGGRGGRGGLTRSDSIGGRGRGGKGNLAAIEIDSVERRDSACSSPGGGRGKGKGKGVAGRVRLSESGSRASVSANVTNPSSPTSPRPPPPPAPTSSPRPPPPPAPTSSPRPPPPPVPPTAATIQKSGKNNRGEDSDSSVSDISISDSDSEVEMENPLRESAMFQSLFAMRDQKMEQQKEEENEEEEEEVNDEEDESESDISLSSESDSDDDDDEEEDDTVEVLKGQLEMAKMQGDVELAKELESNIALWDAIKHGGAIGAAENQPVTLKESEFSDSWLKTWVKEKKEEKKDEDEEEDENTPSWFARWVDGVTKEDALVMEPDVGADSDASLDDDFGSDEEPETANAAVLKRTSSMRIQALARGRAARRLAEQVQSEQDQAAQLAHHRGSTNPTGWSPETSKSTEWSSQWKEENEFIDDRDEETKRRKVVKELLDRAIRTFNVNSKRGVKFVIESGMVVAGDAGGLAEFLGTTKGLNKEKVGEYLGGDDEFHLSVLRCFAKLALKGQVVGFQDAIRLFLSKFRLPGEAQKIDRILEAFADSYFQCLTDAEASGNAPACAKKWMSSPSTIHILAFSTIMLNTDAHNPAMRARERMTKEQFIRNNRGIDDGKDVPKEILEVLYDDIRSSPILTVHERDDEGNLFTHPAREGFMEKRGADGLLKLWKKRYFILNGSLLYYFKKKDDVDPIGFVMLEDLSPQIEGEKPEPPRMSQSAHGALPSPSTPINNPKRVYKVGGELETFEMDELQSLFSKYSTPDSLTGSKSLTDKELFEILVIKSKEFNLPCPTATMCTNAMKQTKSTLRNIVNFYAFGKLVKNNEIEGITSVLLFSPSETIRNKRSSKVDYLKQFEDSRQSESSSDMRASWGGFSTSKNDSGGPCVIKVVPFGGKGTMVKSVRYDAKRRLVKGSHRNLYLRVASLEEGREWVKAIKANTVITGTV